MTPSAFLRDIMHPAAAWAARYGVRSSPEALRFLLAVAGQESNWTHRAQVPIDYAHGFWQFERGGGVALTMKHATSKKKAAELCEAASVRFEPNAVWRAIEGHDGLAYGFARLYLLTDPYKIPTEQSAAWDCYRRVWNPGKPHEARWPSAWQQAGVAVAAETA